MERNEIGCVGVACRVRVSGLLGALTGWMSVGLAVVWFGLLSAECPMSVLMHVWAHVCVVCVVCVGGGGGV